MEQYIVKEHITPEEHVTLLATTLNGTTLFSVGRLVFDIEAHIIEKNNHKTWSFLKALILFNEYQTDHYKVFH